MRLSSPAIVLPLTGITASRDFAQRHLGFTVAAEGNGFVALAHDDLDVRIIFTDGGSAEAVAAPAMQIGFIVTDVDGTWKQLSGSVDIDEPIRTMPSGERYFVVRDPNGVRYRLVQWV